MRQVEPVVEGEVCDSFALSAVVPGTAFKPLGSALVGH
jgi:hypothetical protein